MAGGRGRRRTAAYAAPDDIEDVRARAARLGITEERVLQEYARIAFADILHIARLNADGIMTATPPGDEARDDAPAIAEIVASAGKGRVYRIKLHDKKPVLDALARYLGMLPPKTGPHEEDKPEFDEDPREHFIREVDALRAEMDGGPGEQQAPG